MSAKQHPHRGERPRHGPVALGARPAPAARPISGEPVFQEVPIPSRLPVLLLHSAVVFPSEVLSVQIHRPHDVRLLQQHPEAEWIVGCFYPAERGGRIHSARDDVLPVGVACRVLSRVRMPNETVQVVLEGLRRVRRVAVVATRPQWEYRVEPITAPEKYGEATTARMDRCVSLVEDVIRVDPCCSPELAKLLRLNLGTPERFADLLASQLNLEIQARRRLAATDDVDDRLLVAEQALLAMLEHRTLGTPAGAPDGAPPKARAAPPRAAGRDRIPSREKREGEDDLEDLRARLRAADLPAHARAAAEAELARLSRVSPAVDAYHTGRTYVGWILDLPWTSRSGQRVDLEDARRVLDRDHYGLQEQKERLIEALAVIHTAAGPPVFGFTGPPGTGKTSLGRALAEAAGRPLIRLSVAGADDEAEIVGTPREQPGAVPGRLLQALKRSGVGDPVFMIEDVDKMGREVGGDPAAAVTEAVDPETRSSFEDLYLGVPFDLSPVFFILTANVVYDVPLLLRQRMELITLPGYTPEEKFEIARRHLVPRAAQYTGGPGPITFDDDALRAIIASYTREAGVRHLWRVLLRLHRQVALRRATAQTVPEPIDLATVDLLLGPPVYTLDAALREASVGLATALAWTADGGVVQFVEVLSMPGSGRIVVTGRLGDVMRESADIAWSWVRAHAKSLGIQDGSSDVDLHVHAPEGGIRKDGPSAGVALATAMVSVLMNRPIRPDVAMTGELTLRGEVLAVSGIREKVSAAKRAGIRHVLLPAGNRRDIDVLAPELRGGIHFEFLSRFDDYLRAALVPVHGKSK